MKVIRRMERTPETAKELIMIKVPKKYWGVPSPEELLVGTRYEGMDIDKRIHCSDPWILVPDDGRDLTKVHTLFYSIVKRCIKLGYTSLIMSTEEFISNIQSNVWYDEEADMFSVGCRRGYVALSGFGHESTNAFMKSVAEERLNALLRRRIDNLNPTLLAMGLTMDELFDTYPKTLGRTLKNIETMEV